MISDFNLPGNLLFWEYNNKRKNNNNPHHKMEIRLYGGINYLNDKRPNGKNKKIK